MVVHLFIYLIDTDKEQNKSWFGAHVVIRLQSRVQLRIVDHHFEWNILIKNQEKHRQWCVECCVSKHQHAIVDWNGYEVENTREYHLNNADYEPSMDHKLTQSRS